MSGALTLLDRVELRGGGREDVDGDAVVPEELSGVLVAVDGGAVHDDDRPRRWLDRVVQQAPDELQVLIAFFEK